MEDDIDEYTARCQAEADRDHEERMRDALAEQLACVRQALPEQWRDSVPSVAVATLTAQLELQRTALRVAHMKTVELPFYQSFTAIQCCKCSAEFVLLGLMRGRDEYSGADTVNYMEQGAVNHCPYCGQPSEIVAHAEGKRA